MVALSNYTKSHKGGWGYVQRVKEAHPHRVTIPAYRRHIRYLKDIKATPGISPWARLDCICWRGDDRKSDNDHRITIGFKTGAELEQFMQDWYLDFLDPVGGLDLSQELGE